MKIIIIGAKGMLGTMLSSVFADKDLIMWDLDDIDITDVDSAREKINSEKPSVIINAAAYTNVDGAEENQEAAFTVNATGVRNLAIIAKEVGAKLVHYSTDYVFPGDIKEGYNEDDHTGPAVNVYGESKLAGEVAIQEEMTDFYILRTAWLYGPHGKNFVDTMLQLSDTRDSLSVVSDQHGSPTFTKDVARATLEIIEQKKPYGIYHAVNNGVATWYDFAKKIFEIAGKNVEVSPVSSDEFPRPAKRPKYSILNKTKDVELRSWEEALDDYLKNYYGR